MIDINQPESLTPLIESIVTEFYDLVFADVMIGFLFANANKSHLIKHQTDFTLRLLGVDAKYSGRPLKEVHFPLNLKKGQFNRRQVILREVLSASALPKAIQEEWLKKEDLLRPMILRGMTPCNNI